MGPVDFTTNGSDPPSPRVATNPFAGGRSGCGKPDSPLTKGFVSSEACSSLCEPNHATTDHAAIKQSAAMMALDRVCILVNLSDNEYSCQSANCHEFALRILRCRRLCTKKPRAGFARFRVKFSCGLTLSNQKVTTSRPAMVPVDCHVSNEMSLLTNRQCPSANSTLTPLPTC